MQTPLEIAFHGLQGSPALEAGISQNLEKLERHCRTLVSCRVTVEAAAGKGKPNHHVSVRIQLGLPGRMLKISHDPHHDHERCAHPDAYSVVYDAFRIAERQIQDLKP